MVLPSFIIQNGGVVDDKRKSEFYVHSYMGFSPLKNFNLIKRSLYFLITDGRQPFAASFNATMDTPLKAYQMSKDSSYLYVEIPKEVTTTDVFNSTNSLQEKVRTKQRGNLLYIEGLRETSSVNLFSVNGKSVLQYIVVVQLKFPIILLRDCISKRL